MCKHGNTVDVKVTILAEQSYNGKGRKSIKPIDGCIASIVNALEDAGIHMKGSCCGHGAHDGIGSILLGDGRELFISSGNSRSIYEVMKILYNGGHTTPDSMWENDDEYAGVMCAMEWFLEPHINKSTTSSKPIDGCVGCRYEDDGITDSCINCYRITTKVDNFRFDEHD